MAEKKKKKAPRERTERRFIPEATHASRASAILGMVSSAVLGAGVYGQWVKEVPLGAAPVLVTLGAAGLGFGLWLAGAGSFPVRVGDAGIAIERGSEISRLLWCDILEIRIESGELQARSEALTLAVPLGAHPTAAAYVIVQAEKRLPKILKLDEGIKKRLPIPGDAPGTEVPVTGDQVAGRRCAATQKIISFERDARLCLNCGQVYFKDNVPKTCVTCEAEVAGRAVQA